MKKLFKNGKIYTLDKDNNTCNSMVVDDDKIIELGNDLQYDDCKIVDLKGGYIYPGFNDTHMHLLNYGYVNANVTLFGTKSSEDVGNRIKKFIADNNIAEDEWIRGRGWNNDYFIGSSDMPTRYDLDKVSKTNPIVMTRACGHVLTVNSKVLELLGYDREAPKVDGGEFVLDDEGIPNGIVNENAMDIVYDKITTPNKEQIKEMIYNTVKEMNSQGITSVHTDDYANLPGNPYELVIQSYRELAEEGKLTMRVYEQGRILKFEDAQEYIDKGYITGLGDENFKIGPLKILLDGSLGAKTAAMCHPYLGEEENFGIVTLTPDEIDKWFELARNSQTQLAVHCIGDRAINMALTGFEKIVDDEKDHRHGIVHCQITDIPTLERIAAINSLTYIQPIFLDYDWKIVEERVGKELTETSYNWKTMLDLGIHASFGTDCPVEPFNPFVNIYEAVTRRDLKEEPRDGFLPKQALTIEEALRCYTEEGAYASFEEDIKGSLEVGKLADFIVLEKDLFSIDPMNIKDLTVKETYFGGEKVY